MTGTSAETTSERDVFRRAEFSAMGTVVTVVADRPARQFPPGLDDCFAKALLGVRRIFEEGEARFSRFRDDSELSSVNARAGTWTRVSRRFLSLLNLSLAGAEETGGLFDPTVLPALTAAGYDRDFAQIVTKRDRVLDRPQRPKPGSWRDVEIKGDLVRMPAGLKLDFGGVAKGWTVDAAARHAAGLLPWVLVDAGGDLRVEGEVPPEGLDVRVGHPFNADDWILQLRLTHGALATSSTMTRTWGPGIHHLIDPRTWRPAATGIVQASAWGRTCAEAEVRAKWALLAGSAVFDRIAATLVYDDGSIVTNLESEPARGISASDIPKNPGAVNSD